MTLDLPARHNIAQAIDDGISEDYHLVRLYYSWYAGWFYRRRLHMVSQLLADVQVANLLEVGTGSGIFIKELLKHSRQVVGIDIHASYHGVRAMLEAEGVEQSRVELRQGDIMSIPYPDAHFEAVVCISVLEHFADPVPALQEIRRVLKPGGVFVAGFPAHNPLTTSLFAMLGYRADDIHPGHHPAILAGLDQVFTSQAVRVFPHPLLKMYIASRVSKTQ